ncbi:MAG: hypothetical protein GWO24_19250 [Akkermansiaceae bacterium]|nr:hypothetical protein [Akkermansiaceae bacterium]
MPEWKDIPPVSGLSREALERFVNEALDGIAPELLKNLPDLLPDFIGSVMTDAGNMLDALNMPAAKFAMTANDLIRATNSKTAIEIFPPFFFPMVYWWMSPKRRAREFADCFGATIARAKRGIPEDEPYRSEALYKAVNECIMYLVPALTEEQARWFQKTNAGMLRRYFANKLENPTHGDKPYRISPESWGIKIKSTGLPKIHGDPGTVPARRAAVKLGNRPARPVDWSKRGRFGFKYKGADALVEKHVVSPRFRSALEYRGPVVVRREGKGQDMPKRKKTKSRKVNVPHVEAKAIERRKLRVLSRIYRLFRRGQKRRAMKLAAKLARV